MMVLNGCEDCGCQLGAAPVGMSARRGIASVSINGDQTPSFCLYSMEVEERLTNLSLWLITFSKNNQILIKKE